MLDKYIGIPYRRGGTTENGFDCSGFVRQIYQEFFSIDLPHNSSSQSALPFMQKVAKDDLVTGDLVFFSSGSKSKRINHVGIYLSDGRFIHAARSGVTISSLDDTYWKARFFVAKRVESDDIQKTIDHNNSQDIALAAIYNRYATRFNLLSKNDIDPLALNDSYRSYYSDDTLSMGYEITWSTSMANGSITPEVTAFREYYPYNAGHDIASAFNLTEYGLTNMSNISPDHGMRLATVLSNDEDGVSLTPSFTYYDSGYESENSRLQRYTYGLDLAISPVSKEWLLSLGMQYSEYTYSNNSKYMTNLNEFRSPMNMSFKYQYKLNDSASLSFTGEMVQRFEPGLGSGTFNQWKDEKRSMFLFNFNY